MQLAIDRPSHLRPQGSIALPDP